VAADPYFKQRVLSVLVVGKRSSSDDDDNHDQQNAVAAHGSVSSPVAMVVIIISMARARRTPDTVLSIIEVTADDRGHDRPMIAVPHTDDCRNAEINSALPSQAGKRKHIDVLHVANLDTDPYFAWSG
jgi:hypothetical protein